MTHNENETSARRGPALSDSVSFDSEGTSSSRSDSTEACCYEHVYSIDEIHFFATAPSSMPTKMVLEGLADFVEPDSLAAFTLARTLLFTTYGICSSAVALFVLLAGWKLADFTDLLFGWEVNVMWLSFCIGDTVCGFLNFSMPVISTGIFWMRDRKMVGVMVVTIASSILWLYAWRQYTGIANWTQFGMLLVRVAAVRAATWIIAHLVCLAVEAHVNGLPECWTMLRALTNAAIHAFCIGLFAPPIFLTFLFLFPLATHLARDQCSQEFSLALSIIVPVAVKEVVILLLKYSLRTSFGETQLGKFGATIIGVLLAEFYAKSVAYRALDTSRILATLIGQSFFEVALLLGSLMTVWLRQRFWWSTSDTAKETLEAKAYLKEIVDAGECYAHVGAIGSVLYSQWAKVCAPCLIMCGGVGIASEFITDYVTMLMFGNCSPGWKYRFYIHAIDSQFRRQALTLPTVVLSSMAVEYTAICVMAAYLSHDVMSSSEVSLAIPSFLKHTCNASIQLIP